MLADRSDGTVKSKYRSLIASIQFSWSGKRCNSEDVSDGMRSELSAIGRMLKDSTLQVGHCSILSRIVSPFSRPMAVSELRMMATCALPSDMAIA
jgi:hypothetical protein